MADLDRLLHPEVADAAADAARVPSFDAVERRGVQRRQRRTVLAAGATAVLVAAVVLVGRQWLPDTGAAPLVPAGPSPSAVAVTSPPSSAPARVTGAAPPRDVVPAVPRNLEESAPVRSWTDPAADVAVGAADIREVLVADAAGSQGSWRLRLAAPHPSEASLDAQHRVIAYGVVVDADADHVPDCEIGISNDNDTTTEPADFRVWVRDLRTGTDTGHVGPPYGVPFEFQHPQEALGEPIGVADPSLMSFVFLAGEDRPCGSSGDIYAWSEVREDGRVVARDVAPDAAWLRVGD